MTREADFGCLKSKSPFHRVTHKHEASRRTISISARYEVEFLNILTHEVDILILTDMESLPHERCTLYGTYRASFLLKACKSDQNVTFLRQEGQLCLRTLNLPLIWKGNFLDVEAKAEKTKEAKCKCQARIRPSHRVKDQHWKEERNQWGGAGDAPHELTES